MPTDFFRATLTNTTLDDRDPNVTFSGDWTQQTGPNFFNQTSTYTQGAGNTFEFKFEGTSFSIAILLLDRDHSSDP